MVFNKKTKSNLMFANDVDSGKVGVVVRVDDDDDVSEVGGDSVGRVWSRILTPYDVHLIIADMSHLW